MNVCRIEHKTVVKHMRVKIIAILALALMLNSFCCFSRAATVMVDENTPMILVSDAEGGVGDQVTVTISLKNNPGIISMTLDVMYDLRYLKLISVEDSGMIPGALHENNGIITEDTQTPPYTLSWANDSATENYTSDGTLVTLTFEILADLENEGMCEVTVAYSLADYDIYDCDLIPVEFSVSSGMVRVAAVDKEPSIMISNAEAARGEIVDITISLKNNPGIVSMTLDVHYDPQVMKLLSVTDSGLLPGAAHEDGGIISDDMKAPPYTLAWVNDEAVKSYTEEGILAVLRFQVLEDAASGESSTISVSYDLENYDIYNQELKPIAFAVTNGSVFVTCNHCYVPQITEPTCTEKGYTTYTCTTCGDSYVDDYVDTTGHTYENGICTACGQEKPVTVTAYGSIPYSVDGRIVTVTHMAACVVGYWDETAEQYIAIAATANADGSYSFDTAGRESVVLLVIGDIDGDGQLMMADKTLLDDYLGGKSLTALQQFSADVNENGKINSADRILLARALMPVTSPIYKPFVW